MEKRKGICFFDLDGTLLDNSVNLIPDSAKTALEKLRKNYYIVLSTGRDMETAYSSRFKGMVNPDAIIHQNGSKLSVGDKELFHHYMSRELLKKIFDFGIKYDMCFGTTIGDRDFFTNPEKKLASDRSYTKFIVRNFVSHELLFEENLPVSALSYAGDYEHEKALIEECIPEIELYSFNSGAGADVVEKGFSKAEGMKKMCEYFDIPIEKTYAFGDSPNDIPILKAAGTGIAVGNADDIVKAAADYVTDHIRENGIYNACVHFGLI